MYDELITNVREIEAMCEAASFEEAANVLKEAADAIEKLSKELIDAGYPRTIIEAEE